MPILWRFLLTDPCQKCILIGLSVGLLDVCGVNGVMNAYSASSVGSWRSDSGVHSVRREMSALFLKGEKNENFKNVNNFGFGGRSGR
jgi:hypothetical protein